MHEPLSIVSNISARRMNDILRIDHGVRLIDTGPRKLFVFNEAGVRSIFGPDTQNVLQASKCIGSIIHFYESEPRKDKYGIDGKARRVAEWELDARYGRRFRENPYNNSNSFSGNLMSLVPLSTEILADLAYDAQKYDLGDKLTFVQQRLLGAKGISWIKSYTSCQSDDEKLEYVKLNLAASDYMLTTLDRAQRAEARKLAA